MAKGPVKQLLDLAVKELEELGVTRAPRKVAATARPQGIIAYHGSPHRFDRFDMSKISTGEGAQAYGRGLYFAENEKVAKAYRDDLSKMRVALKVGGKRVPLPSQGAVPTPEEEAADFVVSMGGHENPIRRRARETLSAPSAVTEAFYSLKDNQTINDKDQIARILSDWASKPVAFDKKSTGSMYKVNIAATPEDFLDWDAPLAAQTSAARRFAEDQFGPIDDRDLTGADILARMAGRAQTDRTGRFILSGRPYEDADHVAAAEALRNAGVPGVRYLDQASRFGSGGTRNFVVFDDKLISILKRYGWTPGMALPAAALQAYEQDTEFQHGGLAVKRSKKRG